ncbi:ABC transporter permease subunit [Streptosporangium lutulentum]
MLLAVLALPAVTSPLTAGVAFRLIFDANPDRGLVSALLPGDVIFLGPGWIWLVLGLAFVWQWTGLAFLVFHVGLSTMPADLLRVGRVFGAGRLRRLRTVVIPALFPTAALVMLIVLTAAVRVFDLVLVGVPGSIQSAVDVVGLFWWRHRDDLGDGRASALAILLFAMAVALVMLVLWRLRRDWPSAGPRREDRPVSVQGRPRRIVQVLFAVVAVVWAFPLVALLLTSFRVPKEAATSGWWTGGYGLGSYGEAFSDGSFADALGATAQRGLLVAVVVLLLAVPAAYALTPEQLPRRARRILTTGAVVLVVLPPQALALPLGEVLGSGERHRDPEPRARRAGAAPGGAAAPQRVHLGAAPGGAAPPRRGSFRAVPGDGRERSRRGGGGGAGVRAHLERPGARPAPELASGSGASGRPATGPPLHDLGRRAGGPDDRADRRARTAAVRDRQVAGPRTDPGGPPMSSPPRNHPESPGRGWPGCARHCLATARSPWPPRSPSPLRWARPSSWRRRSVTSCR